MEDKSKKDKKISRRSILPILGSALLIPFLGFGKSNNKELSSVKEEAYQTLLKPDGTTVKVKISTLKNAKTLNKKISNKSLLSWLGRKD